MLDLIKKALFASYNPEEIKGLFFSGYGEKKELAFSEGVVNTDKPLRELVEDLYESQVKPQLKNFQVLAIDVVSEIIDMADPNEILALSPEEFGFILVSLETDQSAVILPNTSGVADAKSALYDAKKKYGIAGKVELFVFRTERILLAK
ncbi:MAG: hypothetical protein H6765_03275 [Candidatus Peribacteria bacterium]|nr:MAG: hypothetical protein H6765_03275 [Candidatus Peribacteria bacterium]